jgi:hypothetical protein
LAQRIRNVRKQLMTFLWHFQHRLFFAPRMSPSPGFGTGGEEFDMTGVSIKIAAFALILAGPNAAWSKTPPAPPATVYPLIGALESCQKLTDDAQRLSCFDRASAALTTAARGGNVVVVDRGEVRAARRSLFGFAVPKLPFFSSDNSSDEASETLDTTIKSARDIGYGRYRFVVAEGDAEWETTESFANQREPRAGAKVQIKRGALGSYLIKIDGQRGVKGKRIG